jgi:hypothetical protein
MRPVIELVLPSTSAAIGRRSASYVSSRLSAAQPGVHPLTAHRAVDVRGVAGQQHATLPVRVRQPPVDPERRHPLDLRDRPGGEHRVLRQQVAELAPVLFRRQDPPEVLAG